LLVAAACVDVGPDSGPGQMTATLLSPHGSEGAAVVVLDGPGVGAIEPVGDTEVYRSDRNGATRLVLINPAGGQLSFWVELADTAAMPTVLIEEVAGPDDELRAGLEAYRVEISP
jgi:hypothetical protein